MNFKDFLKLNILFYKEKITGFLVPAIKILRFAAFLSFLITLHSKSLGFLTVRLNNNTLEDNNLGSQNLSWTFLKIILCTFQQFND